LDKSVDAFCCLAHLDWKRRYNEEQYFASRIAGVAMLLLLRLFADVGISALVCRRHCPSATEELALVAVAATAIVRANNCALYERPVGGSSEFNGKRN
jgi:hypothetical protein